MTLAPNETPEGNARKRELQRIQSERELTLAELYELRDLTRIATSHLVFATHGKKGD